MSRRPIRTLLFSTLYPSSVRPNHGIFVETRLRELLKSGEVQTRVVAPVPWFPSTNPRFGSYAKIAATPLREERNGIQIEHPRYFLLPKIGMNMAPASIARGALPIIRKLIAEGFDFDLIDAHYFYPDGVAAALVAKALGKPLLITGRGTDLSVIPRYPKARARILQAADQAAASIGVCADLMNSLAALGADPSKLNVLRNGVDAERFRPEDPLAARQHLGLPAGVPLWVAVGYLVPHKGQDIAIRALAQLPEQHLALVGSGPEDANWRQLAQSLGVAERVHFIGPVANTELRWWFSAADASVLCSEREGWANVLLESMACGTPVLASRVGGSPEVVAAPEAGLLLAERSPAALIQAWTALKAAAPARSLTRAYAERFSWAATTQGQLALFDRVLQP